MTASTLKHINSKLAAIPDTYANEVMEFLNYLDFKSTYEHFELNTEQIFILEQRRKTPQEQFIPAYQLIDTLKKKYHV